MENVLKVGSRVVRSKLNYLAATGLMLTILLTCGCLGGGEVAPQTTGGGGGGASGKVVQGAVFGATVWADRVNVGTGSTATLGDQVLDTTDFLGENLFKTTTDTNGHFTLPATPTYAYVIVSKGGTDTLSGKPASMMLAPAGSNNVSALTSVVALTPPGTARNNLIANIESLMGGASYDSDISASVTPAALMLAKSIETTVQALTEALNPDGASLSTSQVNDVQLTTMSNLATQLSSLSQAQLATPASLQTAVATSVTTTANTIENRYTNIDILNTTTLGTNISDIVPVIATAIGSTSTTGATSETSQLPTADQNSLNAAVSTSVTLNDSQISVSPPPSATPDTVAPTIITKYPANVAINIPTNSSISAGFSESMDLTTVIPANFVITSSSGSIAGSLAWSHSSNSVTFNPTANLPASTLITVSISGMKDLALVNNVSGTGNPMTAVTWSFTTAAAPDTTNPTISSTTPVANASGVSSSRVTAVFSEPMDPATMNGSTFTLLDNSTGQLGSGLMVPAVVSYNEATRTISLKPLTNLYVNRNYTATITAAAKDLAGLPLALAVNQTWTFTTITTNPNPSSTGSGSAYLNF